MNIDETLKDNLIADLENTMGLEIGSELKASLKRAFEITIGHHYANQFRPISVPTEINDIIKCILNFDSSASIEEKGVYFEVIQRDLSQVKPTDPSKCITEDRIEKEGTEFHPVDLEQVKSRTSCKHEEKYRFTDREGNLRCSDCHKIIE